MKTEDSNSHDHVLKDFQKHLLKPDLKTISRKLKAFEIDNPGNLPHMPYICLPTISRTVTIKPTQKHHEILGDLSPFIKFITPKSLTDLKELMGVSNEGYQKKDPTCNSLRCIQSQHLPGEDDFSFESLTTERREAVLDMAHNLLYGYADEARIAQSPQRGIVRYMLARSSEIPCFLAKDLIVCPNRTIEFKNFGAIYFNNVIVYGSGRIILHNKTKFHAYQIKHISH